MLIDSFNRKLDYLRVSITDRCNLRCVYCMPSVGVEWKPHDSMLRFEETLHLCSIMAKLGIRKIRVTGGEPLVRKGVVSFMQNLKAIPGIEWLTLTTNGFLLSAFLDEAKTLPDSINISLDALDPDKFAVMAGMEHDTETSPEKIITVIDRLMEKNIPVKINCVPISGLNESEILPLAALAKDRNIAIRFIELMPLGTAETLKPVYGKEVAALLERSYGKLMPIKDIHGSGPAVYYKLSGFAGIIGFVSPMSRGFCESCNRLRLTSEGQLKLCLASDKTLDLRGLLRSNASDQEISKAILEAAAQKPRVHTLSGVYGAPLEQAGGPGTSGMYSIGG